MPQSLRKRKQQSEPSRRVGKLAIVLAGPALAIGAAVVFSQRAEEQEAPKPKAREAQIVEAERGLYAAMDAKDNDKIDEAFEALGSSDVGLRLASLRYLCSSGSGTDSRLLELLDDPEARVRRAAIQLLGTHVGEVSGLEARLKAIAEDPDRELSEQQLAKLALRSGR